MWLDCINSTTTTVMAVATTPTRFRWALPPLTNCPANSRPHCSYRWAKLSTDCGAQPFNQLWPTGSRPNQFVTTGKTKSHTVGGVRFKHHTILLISRRQQKTDCKAQPVFCFFNLSCLLKIAVLYFINN